MPRVRNIALAGILTLGLAGATVGLTRADAAPTAPTPATPERHPEIHHALRDLRAARVSLVNADHDFDGHRADALAATDRAIQDCEEALAADKN